MPFSEFHQHPSQLLKKLDLHWKDKLGPLYGKFFVAPGVRWPSEFDEFGEWKPLPPKKPAGSVRFACEEVWLKKASGSEFEVPRRLEEVANPIPMAATAPAYRKPPHSTSENSAADSPFDLLEKARASNLHPRRRMVLIAMLEEGNRFAVEGSSNEIFVATLTVAVALGLPYITVRRAIDALEKEKVLVLRYGSNFPVRDGNGYRLRRPCTYQVNEAALVPRMTVKEHRARRFGEITDRYKSRHSSTPRVTPINDSTSVSSPPAQEAARPQQQPVPAVPVPVAAPIQETSPLRKENRSVREIRKAIVDYTTFLMQPGAAVEHTEVRSQCELELPGSSIQPKLDASPDPWAEVLNQLRRRVNPHTFDTWLKPSQIRAAREKQIFVTIPSREFAHIGEKFHKLIAEAVAELCLGYEEIVFEWSERVEKTLPALSFRAALVRACEQTGIPLEAALEATGWKKKFEESESS